MIHIQQVVNQIFSSNTFVISQDDSYDCWLVDVGDFYKVLNLIPTKAQIKGVFLTHTHIDHIYGINELHRTFPNCVVYTSTYGKEALFSAKKNFSYYHEAPLTYNGTEVSILHEGSSIELYPSVKICVYETPGHCPSCLSYEVLHAFFSGDSYIPGVEVVSKLPSGDKVLAQLSRQRIISLSDGKVLYPGHGHTGEIENKTKK